MTFSPLRKDSQQQQSISDWPRTPLSSRVTGMGAVVPSEWESTTPYEFTLTSFEDESLIILGDVPSVFDTPSQYQSNATDFHPSQNTSARTSISPTTSAAFQDHQRYTGLEKGQDERKLREYSSVNMSRDMSLMPSPSSSNEDGLALLSSGVPHHSSTHHDVQQPLRPRFGPYDLSHLQRRDAIVDPLHLIQNTMIPSVVLPSRDYARTPMLPAIVSRRPSPEEEQRPSVLMQKRQPLYENRSPPPPPMPSVMMQSERPSCLAPVSGPSTYNPNMPSVFAQPQDPNQFNISAKALEMDGWTSSWPPFEEAKKRNKEKKGKATTIAAKPNVPQPNYSRAEGMTKPAKKEPDHQPIARPQAQEERMFVEIKTQFQAIPESSDPNRFSSNGRCLIACEGCKRRKMRCTNEYPTCSNCDRRGIECQYADKVRTRGKAKKHLLSAEQTKPLLDNNRHDPKRRRISTSIAINSKQEQ